MVFGIGVYQGGVNPGKAGSYVDPYPMKFSRSGRGGNQAGPVSTSFTATQPGLYLFVAWGAGGKATGAVGDNGGGGALCLRAVRLVAGQVIPLVVGSCFNTAGNTDTIVTFPDGTMTAGGGAIAGTGAGSPSGLYDIGVAGTATGGAAGSYGGFIGGSGPDVAPGGGFTGGRVEVIRLSD